MNNATITWILVFLFTATIIALVVLLIQARRRNGSLGNQAQDLARTNAESVSRETDAAVEEARELAEAKVQRAEERLKEVINADGTLADDIRGSSR